MRFLKILSQYEMPIWDGAVGRDSPILHPLVITLVIFHHTGLSASAPHPDQLTGLAENYK